MSASKRKEVLVRMPGELKRRLADEAARRASNLNDVAVGILASRFAVPFEPSGRQAAAPGTSGDVVLRMPPELSEKVKRRAGDRRTNANDLIVETLSDRLGVSHHPRRKEAMVSTNGKHKNDDRIRVAIVGVGNCA